jgi:hypothetical protein
MALSRVVPLRVNRNPVVRKVASNPLGAVWSRPSLSDVSEIKLVFPIPPYRPTPAVKGEFQATVRSATSTLPFVSRLNSTATRKMAKPTTVVTRIGPDRPICCDANPNTRA